jgi:hypothetical protein
MPNFFLQMNILTNLSNRKQKIRRHPRLFLSDNNDSVVLPNQLRPAPPIDVIPPYTEGQPFRPIFRHTSAFQPTIYFIRFTSPVAGRLYPTSLQPSHSVYSTKVAESAS